jgi:hypothetical protein
MKRLARLIFVILTGVVVATHGELVELVISGTIENSTFNGRDFNENDPFTVKVIIDTESPVVTSPAPTSTVRYFSNAMKSITATSLLYDSTYANPNGIGRIWITDNGLAGQDRIRLTVLGDGPVFNYNTQDAWQPGTISPLPNAGYLDDLYVNDLTPGPEQFRKFEITLGTFNTNFITNGKLPSSFNGFTFDQTQAFNIQGRFGNSGTSLLNLNISSSVVPEPSTALLMGTGIFGVFLLRRSRHSKDESPDQDE